MKTPLRLDIHAARYPQPAMEHNKNSELIEQLLDRFKQMSFDAEQLVVIKRWLLESVPGDECAGLPALLAQLACHPNYRDALACCAQELNDELSSEGFSSESENETGDESESQKSAWLPETGTDSDTESDTEREDLLDSEYEDAIIELGTHYERAEARESLLAAGCMGPNFDASLISGDLRLALEQEAEYRAIDQEKIAKAEEESAAEENTELDAAQWILSENYSLLGIPEIMVLEEPDPIDLLLGEPGSNDQTIGIPVDEFVQTLPTEDVHDLLEQSNNELDRIDRVNASYRAARATALRNKKAYTALREACSEEYNELEKSASALLDMKTLSAQPSMQNSVSGWRGTMFASEPSFGQDYSSESGEETEKCGSLPRGSEHILAVSV